MELLFVIDVCRFSTINLYVHKAASSSCDVACVNIEKRIPRCIKLVTSKIHCVSKNMCQLIFCSMSVKYEPISVKIGRIVPE